MSGRRKYDSDHRRAVAAARLAWRPGDVCSRCRHPTDPASQRLDLDHDDDSGEYAGLAHSSPCPVCGRRCNQAAGGELAARMAGKQLRHRRCEVCGLPYRATSGSAGARQRSCGRAPCVAELRRRTAGTAEPPERPPAAGSGRAW